MISAGLWYKELVECRKPVLVFGVLLVLLVPVILYEWWIPGDWYKTHESPGAYLYPGGFDDILFTPLGELLWSSWFSSVLLVVSTAAAVVLGMRSLAGEVSRGTAVFLACIPFSPRDLVTTKFFSGACLLMFTMLPSGLVFHGVLLGESRLFPTNLFWESYLIIYFGALVVYSGTMLISSLFSRPMWAGLVALFFWGGLAIPLYFPGTRHFSLFHHMKAAEYWTGIQESLLIYLGAALVIILALYELTVFCWGKKEL